MMVGLMLAIESVVHYTMHSMEDPNVRAFGIPFNAASPVTWIAALVLVIGGFIVARMTWKRVAVAWDEALTAARAKELAA